MLRNVPPPSPAAPQFTISRRICIWSRVAGTPAVSLACRAAPCPSPWAPCPPLTAVAGGGGESHPTPHYRLVFGVQCHQGRAGRNTGGTVTNPNPAKRPEGAVVTSQETTPSYETTVAIPQDLHYGFVETGRPERLTQHTRRESRYLPGNGGQPILAYSSLSDTILVLPNPPPPIQGSVAGCLHLLPIPAEQPRLWFSISAI